MSCSNSSSRSLVSEDRQLSFGNFALPVQLCASRSEIIEADNLLGVKVLELDSLMV